MLGSLMIALALCLAAAPSLSPCQQGEVTDAAIEAAYEALSPSDRREIVDWFSAEVPYAGTFQHQLIRYLIDSAEEDPGLAATVVELRYFDPETYAPTQPIPRKWIEADSKRGKREHKRFKRQRSSTECEPAWSWDWATGALVRDKLLVEDTDRVFRNALRGYAPDFDLAHALLLGRLDDRREEKPLAAFSHAYTDRLGAAFRGITLYDAWNSGANMEMPDVDILGILVSCLGQRKVTDRAPIPPSRHKKVYAEVGKLFQRAARHRKLREVLADCYLDGEPFDRHGYGGIRLNFQALWESTSSRPEDLLAKLPSVDERDDWLGALDEQAKDESFWQRGLVRRDRLKQDRANIRSTLIRVLREFGALK